MHSKRPVRVILILGLIFILMLLTTYRIGVVFFCLCLSTAFLVNGKTTQAKNILQTIPEILLGDLIPNQSLDRQIKK